MIDIVLAVLMIGYAISGFRQGLLVGVLSLGGFVGAAVVAMWLVPQLASNLEPGARRAVVVLVGVIAIAWAGQFLGSLLGARLREEVPRGAAALADQFFGAVAGVVAVALVAWFVAGAVRGGPSQALSRAVGTSKVITAVDQVVPARLSTVAERFRAAVGGSTFPRVFEGVRPEQIRPIEPPDPGSVTSEEVERARRSIVKITGNAVSCGRGQEGSGAVVAPQRVVTNAHVVAGVRRPKVQVGGKGREYDATVVAFDPRRDLAVLAVPDLTARVLPMGAELRRGDPAVVAGFPQDGPFRADAARVRAVVRAKGEDIYGGPGAVREVYSLYARVEPGNSGGPVLSMAGEVVGVVFAKSLDDTSTGYALTLDESRPVIEAGIGSSERVGTGACAAG